MAGPQIDYMAMYRQLPVQVALLTPEFVIADANEAFLRAAGRTRVDVLGLSMFDAFPDNPWDPGAQGSRNLRAAMQQVLATGELVALEFQRHDIEIPDRPGQFARRYWSAVLAPVFGPDGRVALIAFCTEDVSDRMRRFVSALESDAEDEGRG
jgi:PAS domain-containing protein